MSVATEHVTTTRRRRVVQPLVLLATFMWSTNYLLALPLLDAFTPLQLTFVRWSLGLPLLVVAAWAIERPACRTIRRDWWRHLLASATGVVLYNMLNYAALDLTGPANAAVVNAVNPAVIAIGAWLVLRVRVRRAQMIGLALSLVGVVLVISRGSIATLVAMDVNTGELLVLLAVVCWAVYSITGRTLTTPPISSVAVQAAISLILLGPFAATSDLYDANLTAQDWIWLALLVLFPTCLAFVLWNVGVQILGPTAAGVYINTMPVFTTAMAVGLGVQDVSWSLIVGGAIVVIGVLIATVRRSPRKSVPLSATSP